MIEQIALYLHIPFCRRKCGYCSFVSYAGRETDIDNYVTALKKELVLKANGSQVSTIYFGGGTPSLLSPMQINDVLVEINKNFKLNPDAEITIEANPGTIDETYIKAIRNLGINRLSIGFQSLDEDELELLGRIHTPEQAKDSFRIARPDLWFTGKKVENMAVCIERSCNDES
ncbi:MAG: radical SAM protein [Chloroflexi bacterium]|nr:radical SAM protein [Chloroflexota bacterium]